MKYILNATKSLLIGLIDNSLYFRIIDVIADTLPEDLEYFSSIAITTCTYSGSLQINTLQRKGLLMQAGIDANVDIEKQENIVTELGRKLDCYALSLDNEEHWKWHKEHDETSAGNYSVAPNIAIGVR